MFKNIITMFHGTPAHWKDEHVIRQIKGVRKKNRKAINYNLCVRAGAVLASEETDVTSKAAPTQPPPSPVCEERLHHC